MNGASIRAFSKLPMSYKCPRRQLSTHSKNSGHTLAKRFSSGGFNKTDWTRGSNRRNWWVPDWTKKASSWKSATRNVGLRCSREKFKASKLLHRGGCESQSYDTNSSNSKKNPCLFKSSVWWMGCVCTSYIWGFQSFHRQPFAEFHITNWFRSPYTKCGESLEVLAKVFEHQRQRHLYYTRRNIREYIDEFLFRKKSVDPFEFMLSIMAEELRGRISD
jgi:hypothetical protein